LAGTRTGVYAGNLYNDYHDLLRNAGIYDMHAIAGAGAWGSAAGRVAHVLDLRGPSLSVESACSTALLSVHQACRGIWSGDCELAIVGEASLLLDPGMYFGLTEAELLSPGGRCRFGDAHADGFVRAEGAVAVVLKPLARAVRDGDRVYASILGSGVSNNGRTSSSFFSTAVVGQEEMLGAALRDARVSAADLDYVEAHGPGTPGGDTTELTALRNVLREGRAPGERCLIGSVKTNIGHTEGVAGLAGLLKVALSLRKRVVPATLNVTEPHPLLTQPDVPLELALTTRPWSDRGRPGLAGVSAFGMAATNVHVVLTEPPRPAPAPPRDVPAALILPLSARNPIALRELAAAYASTLDAGRAAPDVCHSTGARRAHHGHRVAVTGPDAVSLVAGLPPGNAGPPRCRRAGRRGWCSSSPARARNGWAWAGNCWPPSRFSPGACASATRRCAGPAAPRCWRGCTRTGRSARTPRSSPCCGRSR
jgi:acyl transferase domain-containing protein